MYTPHETNTSDLLYFICSNSMKTSHSNFGSFIESKYRYTSCYEQDIQSNPFAQAQKLFHKWCKMPYCSKFIWNFGKVIHSQQLGIELFQLDLWILIHVCIIQIFQTDISSSFGCLHTTVFVIGKIHILCTKKMYDFNWTCKTIFICMRYLKHRFFMSLYFHRKYVLLVTINNKQIKYPLIEHVSYITENQGAVSV